MNIENTLYKVYNNIKLKFKYERPDYLYMTVECYLRVGVQGVIKMANISPRKNKNGEIISYQIQVYRGRDSNGKKLKPYTMTWKSPKGWSDKRIEKELNKVATLFEEECHKGTVSTEKQTFEQYANYVINLKEKNGAKHRTIYRYRSLLKRIVDAENNGIGHLKLNDIRAEHLNRLYNTLSEEGQNHSTDGGLSAKTIIEHHRLISAVFSQAVKEQLVPYNTAQRATPPKLSKHEAEVFEIEDMQNIIEALEDEPLQWKALTYLLISTGARRGEILGLQWQSVDFKNNQLYLCNNLLYSPVKGVYSTTLKTNENRYVSVPSDVMEILKQWRDEQAELSYAMEDWVDTDYVFTQRNGKPMHPDTATCHLRRFSDKYNLPHINPHKFRHSQASLLINQGVDIVTVSKRLGHAKTSTTSDIYAHILNKADEKASEVLTDVLKFKGV